MSTVYLGRCDYERPEGCTTPEAMFSDYNAWLGELSTQEVIDWTTCKYVIKLLRQTEINICLFRSRGVEGNFIKWSNVHWELKNMESKMMDADVFCRPPFQPDTVLFPGQRNFEEAKILCSQFHGSMAVVKDEKQSNVITGQWWPGMVEWDSKHRDRLKGLYMVARNLFLLLLSCSAWPCLGPA